MANPQETITGKYEDRMSLIYRIKEVIDDIFHRRQRAEKKRADELKKKGEGAIEERREKEAKENWDRDDAIREQQEGKRKYHDSRSGEVHEMQIQQAQLQRAREVENEITLAISNRTIPSGSEYLFHEMDDVNVREAVKRLIYESPGGREVVYTLFTKGINLHGSGKELIKQAQRLSYEADKIGVRADLEPVFQVIEERVENVIKPELMSKLKSGRRRGEANVENLYDYLSQDKEIVITNDEKIALENWRYEDNRQSPEKTWDELWIPKVKDMITGKREPVRETELADRGKAKSPNLIVGKEIVASIDAIWSDLERREATGAENLKEEDLQGYYRQIMAAQSKYHPKDVPAGTEAFTKAIQSFNAYTEEKLNALAQRLKERIDIENPSVKVGITDKEEFLTEIVSNPGHLGQFLDLNPEMKKLFNARGKSGGKFREKIFLKIHSAVLSDQRNSSNDNFGLYQRADFTTFIDLMRTGLSQDKSPETGETLGQTFADYYNNLSNAIRQSRDIDFYATQPGNNMENFQKSFGMFQNEYTYHMMSMPAVIAAFRAYETSLRSIISSNDGYLPPALIEYDARRKGSIWDQRSREMLKQMIESGNVPDIYKDDYTYLHRTEPDGITLEKGDALKNNDIDNDQMQMYMVLAKGLGIASARYIEMMANTRVPGSENLHYGMEGFHSMPYENLAKALNYFHVFIQKWKIGNYKYFYLFNQLIPNEKYKITVDKNDSSQAWRVFQEYMEMDGTFEKKYGAAAKRFLDMTNFSGISSAIGKETTWRQFDSTIRWSDKRKEKLGGGTRITLARGYATEKVKDLLVVAKYREEYRKEIERINSENPNSTLPVSGAGFDKLWQQYGEKRWKSIIMKEWDMLNGKDPQRGSVHTKVAEQTHHLIDAYERAFKARAWVELAMRNPTALAHNLKIEWPNVAAGGQQPVELHSLLIHEILGIPIEDTKYGEEYGKSGRYATPTDKQLKYIQEVLRLEGDIAAVKQIAIKEGRDLEEKDFNCIKDETNRKQAVDYWTRVRKIILGNETADGLYEKFGLNLVNGQDYAWDSHQIHKVEGILKEFESHSPLLVFNSTDGKEVKIGNQLKKALDSEPAWIVATDDMALDEMDFLNLGSRQWMRRIGDIASHEAGGNAVMDYIVHGILPTPDKHEAAKYLAKLRDAYSGDMIEIGWNVGANLAYMTDRLFAWDWKIMGSAAQVNCWQTRRGVAAWLANERREWWDILEHADVLPPHGHFYHVNIPKGTDIHYLRKMCHADNPDVWKEIVFLGVMAAMLMTLWRSITAKDEEDEGGGHH